MAGVAVSAATGALKPLVEKLSAALGKEYQLFKGVRGEIESLTDELDAMQAFLLKMSEEENPDVQDIAWTKEVRELSYDMEDNLDEFMIRVDGNSTNPHSFMDKFKNIFTKLKTRQKIAKEVEELKIQVKEVGKRNRRYKDPATIKNTSNKSVDPRALTIFEDASKMLVGIDRPKAELIELLVKTECPSSSQNTKVVSIVGSGGLGKTTLAHQVYQELKGQFECGAFLSVSRTSDMTNILRIILSEVTNKPYGNTEAGSTQQLIWRIREHLEDKRYIIVIDDVWKEETWKTINYALFRNNKHSRIITTTRMYNVADACCSTDGDIVYEMKPLNYADSKRLFLNRLFGSEGQCPERLLDVSEKILKKCDGVPLAVISISGLLFNKAKTQHEWDRVQKSIGRGLGKNPDAQSMMHILSLSYFDLPPHLKTCLLYLSVFPEDSVIDKGRLVRRWIAEGFIQEEQGSTLYELGERCFNELINRSLIQARRIDWQGEVTACQVHDTILDFIVLKSEEENFVTLFGDGYHMHDPRSKVRRMSVHVSSEEKVSIVTKLNLSHVRSVTVFDYSVELPLWPKFHFLRVLDLQGCIQMKSHHLADLGDHLFQLKYLRLCGTGVCELPEQIRKLQSLEMLEVMETSVATLPASIVELQRLVYLAVHENVKLPDGAGSMTALQDLDGVDISKQSIEFMREVGQMKNLSKVSFFMSFSIGSVIKEAFTGARKFEVADILVLGRLPALVFLQLVVDEDFETRRLTIRGSDGFNCLRQFIFCCTVPVMFEVGAMPNLEKLTLMFSFAGLKIDQLLVSNGDLPFGIHHLSNLDSLYSVVAHMRGRHLHDWIEEKIYRTRNKGFSTDKKIADTVYTLAVAICSLLEAKLRQDPSVATSANDRAVQSRPNFPKLKLTYQRSLQISGSQNRYPRGMLHDITRCLRSVLRCNDEPVPAVKDMALFSTTVGRFLEDTSDIILSGLIQDIAYTTTVTFLNRSDLNHFLRPAWLSVFWDPFYAL